MICPTRSEKVSYLSGVPLGYIGPPLPLLLTLMLTLGSIDGRETLVVLLCTTVELLVAELTAELTPISTSPLLINPIPIKTLINDLKKILRGNYKNYHSSL